MSAHPRFHLNVVGPFYVVDGCCTRCGVPDVEASDLFAATATHCYVRRQPTTAHELDRMCSAIACAEFGCIRYGGDDPAIVKRLAELGEAEICDVAPPLARATRD